MPLHTGVHPTCAVAFCPIYDTARQNFASKVRRLHNLLPQISPPNHLDKIPSPYYHKDTFSKRYRFSFSKSLMAFRHTFSEIKLLNFCRGKARVNLIWDFIRYIRQRFWG